MKKLYSVMLAIGLLSPIAAWAEGDSDTAVGSAVTRMKPVGFSEWDAILKNQRGNITVVDFWASWCTPCIERFPHMVEMHHAYQDRGVRFISLNLDEQDDAESIDWCNEFLATTKAVFANYHMDENMSEAFERLDLLSLPAVRIYATDGSEAYRLSGDNPYKQFTEKEVEHAVIELLAR
jgi:thiol-disulfide isomerase/thioredoxin